MLFGVIRLISLLLSFLLSLWPLASVTAGDLRVNHIDAEEFKKSKIILELEIILVVALSSMW